MTMIAHFPEISEASSKKLIRLAQCLEHLLCIVTSISRRPRPGTPNTCSRYIRVCFPFHQTSNQAETTASVDNMSSMKSRIELRNLSRRIAAWNHPPTVRTLATRANSFKGNVTKKEGESATVDNVRLPLGRDWSGCYQPTMDPSSQSNSKPEGYEKGILDFLEREIDKSHTSTSRAELERECVDANVVLATEGPGSPPRGFRNVREPRDTTFLEHAIGLSRRPHGSLQSPVVHGG